MESTLFGSLTSYLFNVLSYLLRFFYISGAVVLVLKPLFPLSLMSLVLVVSMVSVIAYGFIARIHEFGNIVLFSCLVQYLGYFFDFSQPKNIFIYSKLILQSSKNGVFSCRLYEVFSLFLLQHNLIRSFNAYRRIDGKILDKIKIHKYLENIILIPRICVFQ